MAKLGLQRSLYTQQDNRTWDGALVADIENRKRLNVSQSFDLSLTILFSIR